MWIRGQTTLEGGNFKEGLKFLLSFFLTDEAVRLNVVNGRFCCIWLEMWIRGVVVFWEG